VRALLYALAKLLGDISAILGGPKKTGRRIRRRVAGRAIGKLLFRKW
jgi:hypothetical protein